MVITNNTKIKDIPKDKVGLYRKYLSNKPRATAFSKFKSLKETNVKSYIRKSVNLTKKVKYVTFNKKTLKFLVRLYINGKRHYVGSYKDSDKAVKDLNVYLVTIYNN